MIIKNTKPPKILAMHLFKNGIPERLYLKEGLEWTICENGTENIFGYKGNIEEKRILREQASKIFEMERYHKI